MAAPTDITTPANPSLIPDSQSPSQLDNEIATIHAQISTLTHHRSLLRSTLLSSKPTQSLLTHHLNSSPNSALSTINATQSPIKTALRRSNRQAKHNLLNLHRLCAGATMFRVRDPDPHAVDGGRVYGVRIEVFCEGRFLTPYYLLLTRPHRDSTALRIHRHTIPPCIPLPALVARHLPLSTPSQSVDTNAHTAPVKVAQKRAQRQDLPRLVRELRRELVGWHLRQACVSRLRVRCGLDSREAITGGKEPETRGGGNGIKEVEATDAEGMDIRIGWENGRVGRVTVDKGGRVEKAVVVGEKGREKAIERAIVSGKGKGEGRLEGLGGRLLEVARGA